jgi:1-phosphofructokinase
VSSTRFVTVTLSPLLERTLVTKYLAVGYENQTARPEVLEPSGQGVNIARALQRLECESHAVVLLGNDLMGDAYRTLVAREGLAFTEVAVEGPTCSQTCILDIGNEQETLITTVGGKIARSDVQRLEDTLKVIVTGKDIVLLAGPLPPGAPEDSYARLIKVVHTTGAEAILAAEGPALSLALDAKPEMVALSQLQCESFYNVPIRVQEDLLAAGHRLREQGAGRVLLKMQQAGSALLVTGEGNWRVDLPETVGGTTSGVWEALLAGFLTGHCHEHLLEESMEMAAATAAYTAAEVGAEFGSPEGVKEHLEDIDVRTIDKGRGEQSSRG